VRGAGDTEPVRGVAGELATEHLGDVPLERAAERHDALVGEAIASPSRTPEEPGADEEAEVAGDDGRAHVAPERRRTEVRALLQHVAQEETIRIVAEERVVPRAMRGAGHQTRRRVALAVPREATPAERGAHGALAGVEGRRGCTLGVHVRFG
jgi:hypothetical protein